MGVGNPPAQIGWEVLPKELCFAIFRRIDKVFMSSGNPLTFQELLDMRMIRYSVFPGFTGNSHAVDWIK